MRHLSAEVGVGEPLQRNGLKRLADDVRGLSRKVFQHLPLPWRIEVFEPGMTSPGCAQNVVSQGLQQRALAAAAQ